MIYPHLNRLKFVRAIALAFIISVTPFAGFAQAPAQAPAPEAPPYQWPRSHDYDVQHYRIKVSFDWAKKSVAGETTITFQPFASGLKEVEIDAGNMTINSVRRDGGGPLKFRYEGNEKLFVTLDRAYTAGQNVAVTINYTSVPKQGLTFITPTSSDPNRPYQIWSQGEAKTNHYWFPCYDYPNDRATTEMIATVEDRYQVISNGALIDVKADARNKTKTWHWKMDQPFSSYLVSIIVGEYAEVKDHFKTIPVVSYVYRDQVENARVSFGKLARMVAFFSEKIGYDYPYAKYAQTMVRDFGGAMENITATTMTDTAVHDRRAHLDLSSDTIVSHELVHHWFGNLLTCRDWGEIWLNESFATFFSAAWTEHDLGRDDYLYQMLGNQKNYYQAWAQGNRRPIVTKRYEDPDALFDAYAYPRGAAVLGMLRFVLGEELFWKAIRHYVKKYEWQMVETQQLVVAIEEATGQNLQWFFDEWIYKMGHPEFLITKSYTESTRSLKLTVKQTQKPDDKRPWFQSPDHFTMPVDIAVTTASGEKVHRVWIDGREKEFTFTVDSKPLIVNFDRGNYIIKQVKFDRSDEELAYQLLHDSDVMGRVLAANELRSKRTDAAAAALAEAALKDPFWAVRIEAVKAMSGFKNDRVRAALIEAARDKDSRIRREALKGLAQLKDASLAELYIRVIQTDQSYFAVAEAAKALGQSGAPQAYNVLMGALNVDSWQETIRGGVMEGLAALKDPRALDVAFKYAVPGNPVSLRVAAFRVLGDTGKGNDRALEILTAGLKEQSLQLLFSAVQALATMGDARAIPALEEFLKGPLPPGIPEGQAKQFIGGLINRLKNAAKQK
ncbi:MAG: HEAT repeat domain-containing protein [Blastocatellia bacterium]|nr:HEAT repeat domain-containing protein [Blastocatellia bacterium]